MVLVYQNVKMSRLVQFVVQCTTKVSGEKTELFVQQLQQFYIFLSCVNAVCLHC